MLQKGLCGLNNDFILCTNLSEDVGFVGLELHLRLYMTVSGPTLAMYLL